jgi:hypothetical protein
MGEYEATIERLNKVLTENGFAMLHRQALYPPKAALLGDNNGVWNTSVEVRLRFDNGGKYIKPENGDYPKNSVTGSLV